MDSDARMDENRLLVVLVPVYDDWEALTRVVEALDQSLKGLAWRFRVLVVDDGSTGAGPPASLRAPRDSIGGIDVLQLRRNLGHQRAIAVGLAWLEANLPCAGVVVMDGDGEDAPGDVPRLVTRFEETGGDQVIFAARLRRSEGPLFQAFYHLYRLVHRVLTGISVRVGNFSLLPWPLLRRLVVVSDLWNHYAAAVFKARLPMSTVPTQRARRLGGRPKTNFTALVVHGMSAISVFSDRIGVRLLIAAGGLSVVAVGVLLGLSAATLAGVVPASAGLLAGAALVLVLLLQVIFGVTLFAFGVLGSRDTASFLPVRDYAYFVDRRTTLWTRDAE